MMNKKGIYISVAVLVVIAIVLVWITQNSSRQQGPNQPSASAQTSRITKVAMSRSVDAQGNATGETSMFDVKKDKVIYAVLSLQNVTKKTQLGYVRYLNGKYVDSKVAFPSRDNMGSFYFTFEKGLGKYPKGNYTIVTYVNGQRSVKVDYVFK